MPDNTTAQQNAARIADGARVTLHFSLALPDGQVIDSNFEDKPATFVVGDGNLLPGFEAALSGLAAGDTIDVVLPAEQAFGAVNPENVQSLPRQQFAGLLANTTDPLVPGTVLAFTDAGGNDIPGVVLEIGELMLVIDFNHPLAGREIVFKAQIISVIPAGTQTVKIHG